MIGVEGAPQPPHCPPTLPPPPAPVSRFAPLPSQLAHVQCMGAIGWGAWDLDTGDASWSDQLFTIFGRSRADGPVRLDGLAALTDPRDLPILHGALRDVGGGVPRVRVEFRAMRHDGPRHLRAVLEPVTPAGGGRLVYGVVQDVTGPRRAEHVIHHTRRLNHALGEAILPAPAGTIELPGAKVAVRYLPTDKTAGLGGDWYEAAALPDGRALLAIGDVSGHGRPVIAPMARLRHALAGLVMTGEPPDRLLTWLNELVWHRCGDVTATALVGHLDPATGVFVWAQAGHPAPILVSGGSARQLAAPDGQLLGAALGLPYLPRSVTLRPGDVLLLFTDGLVERRRRDIDEGLALAQVAAVTLARGDLGAGLDRLIESMGGPNPEDDVCLLAVMMRR